MAIKKVPKNYDTTLNRRKQHLNDIVDALNNVTDVVANPEGSSTEELKTLKVGDTIYAVNKPSFDTIKAMKVTIDNGGQYCTSMPKIEFYDDGGNVANLIVNSDYTMTSEHSLHYGGLALNDFPGVTEENTPNTFTIVFASNFDSVRYHLLKMTRGGTFVNDIAKNIKIELSVDGTNFITIYDETSITWSDAVTSHKIDIVTGEEYEPMIPYFDGGYSIPVIDRDGVFHSMLPIINIGLPSTRPVKDSDGYYESDCYISVPYNRLGLGKSLTPEDFDNVIIGLGTQIFVALNLNDGTNNINLRGCGSWNMQAFDSTSNYMTNIAGLLEYINYDNYLVDSDKYEMYDCTLTRVNDMYHIKFKLEKITTT